MKKIKYIRYLDYLRIFLAMFVVFIHLNSNNITVLNTWFVDPVLLFFAISGYANFISWKKEESIWSYYKKRIWTLALSGIIIGIIIDVSYFAFHTKELTNLDWTKVTTLSFIKSFIIHPLVGLVPYFSHILPSDIHFPGTWKALYIDKSNPVLWSLRIELLFYLIFPFIMKAYFYFQKWKINPIYLLPVVSLLVQHYLFNNVVNNIDLHSVNGQLHNAIEKSPLLLKDLGIYNPLKIFNSYMPHFFIGMLCAQLYINNWQKMWIFARKYKNIILIFKVLFLVKVSSVLFTLFMQIAAKKEVFLPTMSYYNSTSLLYYYFIEWVGIFIVFMFVIFFDLSSINYKTYYEKLKNNKKKLNLGLITYIVYVCHPYMIKLFYKQANNGIFLSKLNYEKFGLKELFKVILSMSILIVIITTLTYFITMFINKLVFKKKK